MRERPPALCRGRPPPPRAPRRSATPTPAIMSHRWQQRDGIVFSFRVECGRVAHRDWDIIPTDSIVVQNSNPPPACRCRRSQQTPPAQTHPPAPCPPPGIDGRGRWGWLLHTQKRCPGRLPGGYSEPPQTKTRETQRGRGSQWAPTLTVCTSPAATPPSPARAPSTRRAAGPASARCRCRLQAAPSPSAWPRLRRFAHGRGWVW